MVLALDLDSFTTKWDTLPCISPATNTDDIIVTCMEGADLFEGADFFDCGEGLDMTIDFSPENGDDNVGICEEI